MCTKSIVLSTELKHGSVIKAEHDCTFRIRNLSTHQIVPTAVANRGVCLLMQITFVQRPPRTLDDVLFDEALAISMYFLEKPCTMHNTASQLLVHNSQGHHWQKYNRCTHHCSHHQ